MQAIKTIDLKEINNAKHQYMNICISKYRLFGIPDWTGVWKRWFVNAIDLSYNDVKRGFEMLHEI